MNLNDIYNLNDAEIDSIVEKFDNAWENDELKAEPNPHYRGPLRGLRPELVEEIVSKAQTKGVDPHELLNEAVENYLRSA